MCLDAGPEQPREQILVFRKLGSAAFLHHVDKGFVDFKLQGFQPLDVCLLFWLERIERHLVGACRIDAAFHADLLQKLGEAKRGRHDTDRTDDR